jgi:hypothetical protein
LRELEIGIKRHWYEFQGESVNMRYELGRAEAVMSRRGRESLYSKGTTEKFHRRD